jgi:orotidine-5'-phosphate decarboxylase
MTKKSKDFIVFPLDFPSAKEAEDYVRLLDGQVGMFKIGLELFIQEGPDMVRRLKSMTSAAIFLDLKLHDISATVNRAMSRVAALGVDLVTVHCASEFMLEKAVAGSRGNTGVLGVTLLTDNDAAMVRAAGFKKEYADSLEKLVRLRAAMAGRAGCAGVVCSGQEVAMIRRDMGPGFLTITPGIRPAWSLTPNDDQKRVTLPARAVAMGSDYIVIGRPIRDADDPARAAQMVADEIDQALAD